MRTIQVKTEFEGIHCWPEAPEEVSYLRNPHRHIFKVEAEIEVMHDDRELEFMMVKHRIERVLRVHADDSGVWQMGRMSCEEVAELLFDHIHSVYDKDRRSGRYIRVGVFEDGENGAVMDNRRS